VTSTCEGEVTTVWRYRTFTNLSNKFKVVISLDCGSV